MNSAGLTPESRDELYTALCMSISDCDGNNGAPMTRTELYLSRLCLLLIERVGDADIVREALREAGLKPRDIA